MATFSRCEIRGFHAGKVAIQVEVRRQRDDFIALHLVVAILRIAEHGAVHRSALASGVSMRRTVCADFRRLLRSLAGQREHLGRVLDQMLSHLFILSASSFM